MTRKMELPKVAARKSSYWNRQIFYACLTLVLMMAGFAALYCGVYFGLNDKAPEMNNVTSENGIPISPPHSVEINQPTPPQPTISNSTTYSDENVRYVTEMIPPSSSSNKAVGSQCVARNLAFCNNTLNYTETVYPNLSGDISEGDFVRSWAFLQTVIDSYCHPMIEEFVCQAAQPECRHDGTIGPCRQLCLDVAKACDPHVWSILEKEKTVFNCDQYAEPDNQNLCYSSRPISSSYVNAKM